MGETTLHSAVRFDKLSTRQGLLQKLFAHWFDAFVYNQIWEDPRVDLEALDLNGDSRILTIASGGCNALNYLLEGPRSVTAVDLNRSHVHLVELKIAALRSLPSYEKFFAFFGAGRGPDTGSDYLRYIRPHLSRSAQDFWESNTLGGSILYGNRISFFRDAGLYDHSRNGYFLKFFQWMARLSGCRPEMALNAKTAEEQEHLYERHIDPFFDTLLIRSVGRLPVTMFGLGIPPQQFDELTKDLEDGGTIIDVLRSRVRRLACGHPIDDNYFAWQAFARKYDTGGMKAIPEYLKAENFEALRGASDRIETVIGSATDLIRERGRGAFDRFVFLDAQDWMNADAMTELWSAVAENGAEGSRIIFRTAGSDSPLDANLPADLRSKFKYERETSQGLFARDRASIYGGFHLYVMQ